MTKPITNVAAMMLYEEGRFLLNDPVSKFMPSFKQLNVLADAEQPTGERLGLEREMTIRDLMLHTAGLAYDLEGTPLDVLYEQAGLFRRDKSLQEIVAELVRLPLMYQPGSAWRYSIATDVLGHLVEVVADMPFDDFLKERMFEPLGMGDTNFYVPPKKAERFTALYNLTEAGGLARNSAPFLGDFREPPRSFSGGAGLVSTARDHLRFSQMLLNGGELDGTRLLGRKTVALMIRNHLPQRLLPMTLLVETIAGRGFGLGVNVVTDVAKTQGFESIGNYGWGGAASTHFWIDPQEAIIGLVLTQFMPVFHYPLEAQLKVLTYQALVD